MIERYRRRGGSADRRCDRRRRGPGGARGGPRGARGRARRDRARGTRPGRGADLERADRRRQGGRARCPVGRPDPGSGAGADPRARARDLPDLGRGQEHLRARRQARPLLGHDPAGQPGRARRGRGGDEAPQSDGGQGAAAGPVAGAECGPTGTPRPSRPGCGETCAPRSPATSCGSRSSASGPPSPAMSRCCTSSSTSARRARSRSSPTPRAAPSRTGSSAARS